MEINRFKRVFTKIILIFSLLGSLLVQALDNCQTFYTQGSLEQINTQINGIQIQYSRILLSGEKVKASDLFGETEDVFLGINHFGHAYIVTKNIRFDGNMIGRQTNLNNRTDILNAGIVFRIRASAISKSRNVLSKRYGVTCVSAACGALAQAAGIYIGSNRIKAYRSDTLVSTILSQGFRDRNGNTIDFETYYIGSGSIEQSFVSLQRISSNFAFNYGVGFPAVAIGTITFGALAIVDLLNFVRL